MMLMMTLVIQIWQFSNDDPNAGCSIVCIGVLSVVGSGGQTGGRPASNTTQLYFFTNLYLYFFAHFSTFYSGLINNMWRRSWTRHIWEKSGLNSSVQWGGLWVEHCTAEVVSTFRGSCLLTDPPFPPNPPPRRAEHPFGPFVTKGGKLSCESICGLSIKGTRYHMKWFWDFLVHIKHGSFFSPLSQISNPAQKPLSWATGSTSFIWTWSI